MAQEQRPKKPVILGGKYNYKATKSLFGQKRTFQLPIFYKPSKKKPPPPQPPKKTNNKLKKKKNINISYRIFLPNNHKL